MHLKQHLLFDSDIALLRKLEMELGSPDQWKRRYGPPAGHNDDSGSLFRKWMDKERDKMPWKTAVDPGEVVLDRVKLLDRLDAHTKHCKACLGRYKGARGRGGWPPWRCRALGQYSAGCLL